MANYRIVTLAALAALAFSGAAQAGHVSGYTKKDGTYVAPYERTNPNNTKNDNYSTLGNVNPYTGKAGTKPGDAGTAVVTPAPKVTAVCKDGALSYSQNRSGTCSSHGGVATWY